MRARTPSDLSSFLRSDLAWRRKENSVLHSSVRTSEASKKQAILRGAVAVLYAHWEGFVKTACRVYLEFVSLRKLKHSELAAPLLSLALRRRLSGIDLGTQRLDSHVEFSEWLINEWDRRAWLPNPELIVSTSNLTSVVFRNMFRGLGLTYHSAFQVAEKPVIDPLVQLRNYLAHGEWRIVEEVEYNQFFTVIDRLLEQVCSEVETAAATGTYRR